jgi:flagellar biosynthesis protein FlhB
VLIWLNKILYIDAKTNGLKRYLNYFKRFYSIHLIIKMAKSLLLLGLFFLVTLAQEDDYVSFFKSIFEKFDLFLSSHRFKSVLVIRIVLLDNAVVIAITE